MKAWLVLSSATALAIYYYFRTKRTRKGVDIILPVDVNYEKELRREQLARNYAVFGEEGMGALHDTFVIIVGLGGVGSAAAFSLARSGIGGFRFIDFDQISLSSLNRHMMATRLDVGKPKAQFVAETIHKLCPWTYVEYEALLFDDKSCDKVLMPSLVNEMPNLGTKREFSKIVVLDCIDHVNTKVSLLRECILRNLKVISSMGAGCKLDPTKVVISDLMQTSEDPLARAVRVRLKPSKGQVMVISSVERPNGIGLVDNDADNLEELAILPDFRARILPVLGPLPNIFGLIMATHVLTTCAGRSMAATSIKLSPKTLTRYREHLKNRYSSEPLLSIDDIRHVVEDVWQHQSSICLVKGIKSYPPYRLIKLDESKDLSAHNLILITKHEEQDQSWRHDPKIITCIQQKLL